jgi:hypothetical protein
MNLPYDIIIYIYTYLDVNKIRDLKLTYLNYKSYIKTIYMSENKPELWYRGVYNNLNNNCFICESKFENYFIIICLRCEFVFGEYCSYPIICDTCIDCKINVTRKVLCKTCPSCRDKRMHVAIKSQSRLNNII